jgi:hypothetical protein
LRDDASKIIYHKTTKDSFKKSKVRSRDASQPSKNFQSSQKTSFQNNLENSNTTESIFTSIKGKIEVVPQRVIRPQNSRVLSSAKSKNRSHRKTPSQPNSIRQAISGIKEEFQRRKSN